MKGNPQLYYPLVLGAMTFFSISVENVLPTNSLKAMNKTHGTAIHTYDGSL